LNRVFVRIQRWKQGIPRGAANVYDKLASVAVNPLHELVARDAALLKPERVVDIGCGPGDLLLELVGLEESVYCVGIDISRAMARISWRNAARRGVRHRVDVVVADAHKLPLRHSCLDLLLSTGTLHHIRRPADVFRECARVLKGNGEAWIYEFSHDAPRAEVGRTAREFKRPILYLKLVAALHGLPRHEFVEGYIRRELEEAGVRYEVVYDGAVTRVVIGPRGREISKHVAVSR